MASLQDDRNAIILVYTTGREVAGAADGLAVQNQHRCVAIPGLKALTLRFYGLKFDGFGPRRPYSIGLLGHVEPKG